LMGGDIYDNQNAQNVVLPGVVDLKWGNGYKNDVWSTTGTLTYLNCLSVDLPALDLSFDGYPTTFQ
jgi:hypothetical protein